MPTITTVAVIGLGNMGAELALRLARRWPLLGYDLDHDRASQVAARGSIQVVDELRDLSAVDVVVLSLPSRDASMSVVRPIAPSLREGAVIVETSTVNPDDVRAMADVAAGFGVELVDAAILSGVAQMSRGEGAIMASGPTTAIDRVSAVLDALSLRWQHVGSAPGAAMAAKVIHNAVIHAVMVVLVEAGAMAVAHGVDNRLLADILQDPERGLLRPLTHRFVDRVLTGQLDGGMPVEAARKDSVLALELAQQSRVPLFGILATHTVYELAVARGLSRLDYAAISRLWEEWGGFQFAPTSPATEESTLD